jgi:hypothetical protein
MKKREGKNAARHRRWVVIEFEIGSEMNNDGMME